jgi:hypothetical protein
MLEILGSKALVLFLGLGSVKGDLWLALFLYITVWLYAWAKGQMGDGRMALIYTLIITFLVFYSHPFFVWVVVGFFVFKTYGKELFGA